MTLKLILHLLFPLFKDTFSQIFLSVTVKRSSVLVIQSCLTHWDPMDCSPARLSWNSSVHGILQARILEGCHWNPLPLEPIGNGLPFPPPKERFGKDKSKIKQKEISPLSSSSLILSQWATWNRVHLHLQRSSCMLLVQCTGAFPVPAVHNVSLSSSLSQVKCPVIEL